MGVALGTDFLALCARYGADANLIQASGGNSSVKQDGVMAVKASGTQLAQAQQQAIFVEVDIASVLAELDKADSTGDCQGALIDKSSKLRPSIETTFHALLPQRYVFHLHAIDCIAHSSSSEGRALLADKLQGLDWQLVPYHKPGLELARAMRAQLQATATSPQVWLLANHGLIVAAESLAEVESLVEQVQTVLALDTHTTELETPSLTAHAPPEGWHWQYPNLAQQALATRGSYYPDHVVFLGPALPSVKIETMHEYCAHSDRVAVVIESTGVLIRNQATAGQKAMLRCLHDLLTRLPQYWHLDAIGSQAESQLLNWDAEQYRQALSGCKLRDHER